MNPNKKFALLLLTVVSALFPVLSGQAPSVRWSGQYPTGVFAGASFTPEDAVETGDGVVICGTKSVQVNTSTSLTYVFLMKVSQDGQQLWYQDYDIDNPVEGYESSEEVWAMIPGGNGNFLVAGSQSLPPIPVEGSTDPPRPASDVLIMEFTADGTLEYWDVVEDENDWSEAHSIQHTKENTIVISGLAVKYDSQGRGDDRILLMELNGNDFQPLTQLTLPYPDSRPAWGDWAMIGYPVDGNSSYLVAGSTINNKFDLYLMNVDETGAINWSYTYGGDENDQLSRVLVLGEHYYLAGSSKTMLQGDTYAYFNAYVAKTDREGNLVDAGAYGRTGTYYANDISLSPDGQLLITGTHEAWNGTNIYLAKVDTGTLDSIWIEEYEGEAAARFATPTAGYGLLIAGRSLPNGVPQDKMYLAFLDYSDQMSSTSFPRWALDMTLVSTEDNVDVCTITDLEGDIRSASVTLNELLHPAVENLDIYLEHSGQSVQLVAVSSVTGENFINTRFTDASENLIEWGIAPYTSNFRPAEPLSGFSGSDPKGDWTLRVTDHSGAAKQSTLASLNGWTLTLLTEGASPTGWDPDKELAQGLLYPCFPNPAANETLISFQVPESGSVQLTVIDASGQVVDQLVNTSVQRGTHTLRWGTEKLPGGTYFIRLRYEGITAIQKVIVAR
ncbi:MAG: T9SS type A sorting domain-containing protein [Bacteroidales bacterium]